MSKVYEWKVAVAATVVAGALAATSLPSVAATLYRWTDTNGTPVISDRPPPQGTAYTTLDGGSYGISGSLRAPAQSSEPAPAPASGFKSNGSTADPDAPQSASRTVVEKRPDLCAQAQDNIFKLETFPRIRTTDDDGTVRFMTEEEIAGQLATAKVVADANC